MTCADLRRLVAEGEGSALESPEARAHLATCEACRSMVEHWSEAMVELRGWASDEPPPFLHGRLMAHVRAEGARRERARRGRLAWWAPALAATFIAVVGGLALWRAPWLHQAPAGSVQPRVSAPAKVKASPALAPQPSTALARASAPAAAKDKGAPATPTTSDLDGRGVAASSEVPLEQQVGVQGVPHQAVPRRRDAARGLESPPARPPAAPRAPGFAPEPEVAGGVSGGVPGGVPGGVLDAETLGEAQAAPEKPQARVAPATQPAENAPAEEMTTGRLKSEGQPASHAPTLRARVAGGREAQAPVVCLLVDSKDKAGSRRVTLASDLAPPPGRTWHLMVASTGEVSAAPARRLADEVSSDAEANATRRTGAIPAETLEALARLGLAPGSYSLRRAPQAP
jgi:hypothetical protein